MKSYNLTIEELSDLCRNFQTDCFDGFVSNDNSYIKNWLKIKNHTEYSNNIDCLGEIIDKKNI
jgi:hypothetical protein